VNINQPENPGLALDAKILLLSPELHREHLRVRTLHSYPADVDFIVSLSVAIKGDAIAEVTSHFHTIKEFAEFMLPDPSLLNIVMEGHNMCIGFNVTPILRIAHYIEPHKEIIKKV